MNPTRQHTATGTTETCFQTSHAYTVTHRSPSSDHHGGLAIASGFDGAFDDARGLEHALDGAGFQAFPARRRAHGSDVAVLVSIKEAHLLGELVSQELTQQRAGPGGLLVVIGGRMLGLGETG
ncbi:unnamed protein product [Urochloa humidicola]